MKLPDLRPVLPSKDIRLTLKPQECIALYTIIEQATSYWDERAEKEDTPLSRAMSDLVWEVEGKLSDKLDFKAVR